MGFLLKLRVLLWKNFIIRRRNKFRFIMETLYPLVLFAILVALKPQTTRTFVPECHRNAKAMPSAGRLPFLHSFLCRADNLCINSTANGKPAGSDASNVCQMLNPHSSRRLPRLAEQPSRGRQGDGIKQPQPGGRRRGLRKPWQTASDPDEPEECQAVANTLMYISFSEVATWPVIKPFITGTVLYYPDTHATRTLMSKINATFNSLTTFDFNQLADRRVAMQELLRSDLGEEFTKAAAAADDTSIFAKLIRNETLTEAENADMDDMAQQMAEFMQNFEKCVNREKVRAVTAETALNESWALERTNNLWALVEFEEGVPDDGTLGPLVKYKIRMNADKLPPTVEKKNTAGINLTPTTTPLKTLMFTSFGFTYLQDMIDSAIIQTISGRADADRPGRILMQFPDAASIEDPIADMMTQLLPLMMVLAWVSSFSGTVKNVVLEKEERVKEVLAVMGLGRGVQWAGWVAEGLRSTLITCVILVLIMKFGKLAEHSDAFVVLLLLVSFVVAMLSFAMLVSCLFTRATLAGPAASVIYFLTYLAYQLVQATNDSEPTFAAVLSASLLSNVALAQGTLVLASLEAQGEGAQWGNLFLPPSPEQPATMAGSIGMLWLDAALYALFAWYIDNVFPGEFGVPKPFYFFLQKSYWFDIESTENERVLQGARQNNSDISRNLEPEPENAVVGVAIDNLSKVFGKKAAVNGLTLNFYQDQINCFLGHNGAGKTTTISMLTGLYTPSAGTARLYGRDIRTDMDAIRASMGVCPQQNIIFSSLTVEEHLQFFGRIKGIKAKVLNAEIDGMLAEMDLEAKRKARATTLSGGMKRKLSVAMAFVGGSRVVFLDEPTAGVDPFSRRGIWELLVKFRQGRTIILTTHFMDEADLLGDRIAIMSEGRLQCCGSAVFLKERLGSGYHLTVEWVLQEGAKPDEGKDNHGQRRALLLQEVLASVPAARPGEAADANEAVFVLPDRHDVPAITALLERLDARRGDLGIASYAVSDTALEEVFLKVAEQKSEDSSTHSEVTVEDDSSDSELLVTPLVGWSLLVQQYAALVRKRFHYVRRDPKALFTQLVLPSVFVLVALALSSSSKASDAAPPAVQLSPDMFAMPVVGFFEQRHDKVGSTWPDRYAASLVLDGVGSRLADGAAEQWTRPTQSSPDFSCTNSPPGGSGDLVSLPSGDLYYNASGVDVEGWLTATAMGCRRNRYGGASFGVDYPLQLDKADDNVMIWFNNKRQVAAPAYQNAINNVILRASLPPLPAGRKAREFGIQTASWPLPEDPVTKEEENKGKIDTYEMSIVLSSALTVIFAMSFVPATFVMFLVEERTNQAKHVQLVAGLRPYIYWLQSYTWDLMSYIGSEVFVIIIFLAYQTPMYTEGDNLIALIFLVLLFGMSCTPMLYLASWFFRIPTMAFLVLSTGNLFIGMVTTITVTVMRITNPDEVHYVESTFLILPQYCLGQGLMNMAMNHITNQIKEMQHMELTPILSWDLTVRYMVAMAGMAALLAVAVFLAEQSTHWWHGWQQAAGGEAASTADDAEDDVRREQQRVAAGQADGGMLVLKRITKRYSRGGRPAVDGVSLGVERGQCFGLLGLNGAGKTTIFKMLTGDTLISGGNALVAGRSVRADMDGVRRLTGYCPQFDALVPLLTVREHLDLYSSLRGVPRHQRPAAVQRAIAMMDLGAHQDKQAKSLSGGNKRKLSAAIALVGDPALLYMDEPTTSMDPVARRFVWQRVRRVVAAGRSVLLTSHSMEECEALCARLTIMVNGRLTCIGSPHHLKQKYGSGYVAVVRCASNKADQARALLLQRLTGASVVEAHWHQMKLQVPPEQPLLAIFRALDEAQRAGYVKDYSLSQTTLEDVFMRFARAQKTETP